LAHADVVRESIDLDLSAVSGWVKEVEEGADLVFVSGKKMKREGGDALSLAVFGFCCGGHEGTGKCYHFLPGLVRFLFIKSCVNE